MNSLRILCAILALLTGLNLVAGTITSSGYKVTLYGATLAPHGTDPAHTSWGTETVANPSGVTYVSSVKPEDVVWSGNPDPVLRFPGLIEKTTGTFILDNVKGFLKVAGHPDLGAGIFVRITRFSSGTVGYNGGQQIKSGPLSQELTRLDLSGFGVWLEALTAAEENSALQSLRSLPSGTLVTYGYEVEDLLFTQTIALETATVSPSVVLERVDNDTFRVKTTPAGGTGILVQRQEVVNGAWSTVTTLADNGTFDLTFTGGAGFYRALIP